MNRISRGAAGRLAVALLIGGALIAASGCTAMLPGQGKPPDLYDLSPKSTFPEDLPTADWQLVVETPVAAASLNTARIALKRKPMKLEYYSGATWTDLAPHLVQTLMIESFENTGKIVSVGREDANLRSDYLLKAELREFQAEYLGGTKPRARVRITAKLVKMPQRTIIAGASFEHVVEASGDNIPAIIEAFDEALGKTLKRLVIWALNAPRKAGGN